MSDLPTADPNAEEVADGPANYDGYLLAAAKRGNVASMKEVLNEHIDEVNINVQDGMGNCPLHYSANWGHFETLEVMLAAKADPNTKNFQHDTALHRAFYKNDIPMIELLLKSGASPRIVNKQGMMPGDYAQTVEARRLREIALGATKEALVKPAPPVPDRSSKRAATTDNTEIDFSKMANMRVDEKDLDEDG